MIPFDEALATVDRILEGKTVATETVAARDAFGRVLAEDAVSRLDLPPFDKSAMDGYAVRDGDASESFRVIEEVPAGKTPRLALTPGTATRVMTGAPVPEGAGRVIPIEETDGGRETVRPLRPTVKSHICRRGEDVRAGQAVLRPGARLDAPAVATLLSCGVESVRVSRRVRAAVLVTGDEIVPTFDALAPGRILDSNGPMLAALVAEHGMEVALRRNVPDDRRATADAIREAADAADIVAVTGGVSAGDFDFVPDALRENGFTIHFDRVASQPGKPLTFATRGERIAVGLPGNPISVFVGFHFVVRRAAAHLAGARPSVRGFPVPLRRTYKRRRTVRAAFVPCTLDADGCADPLPYHGSAHLNALCAADGFLQIPVGVGSIPEGGRAVFYPLFIDKRP